MFMNTKKYKIFIFLAMLSFLLGGCATAPQLKQGSEIVPPEPIYGNSGEFMSPYTEDDVLADWVDKAVNAKASSQIGGAIGAYAGSKALEMVPLVGGILGNYVGKEIGRQIAITASGGMEYITSTSDLSFNKLDKLSVFLYAKYSTHEHFQDALDATTAIYPDLQKIYFPAIYKASAEAPPALEVARLRAMQEEGSDDDEDEEETEVLRVKVLQADGSVTESKTIISKPVQELQPSKQQVELQEKQDNVTSVENTAPIKLKQTQSQATAQATRNVTTSNTQPIEGTIISEKITVEPSTEEITTDTVTDVNEIVQNSDHEGSFGSTTSKITTITKTVSVPGEKTIIERTIMK